MKKTISLFALSLWASSMLFAQPCKQIALDSTQKRIFYGYIDECMRDGYFVGDKGIVEVTRFINKAGRPTWQMILVLDDRYKDNPPTEWAKLEQDVILFYNANYSKPQSSMAEQITPTPELLKCLDEAIGDRVYIRPPKRDRTIEIPRPGKAPIKGEFRRLRGQAGLNEKRVIFDSDGKVKILSSV